MNKKFVSTVLSISLLSQLGACPLASANNQNETQAAKTETPTEKGVLDKLTEPFDSEKKRNIAIGAVAGSAIIIPTAIYLCSKLWSSSEPETIINRVPGSHMSTQEFYNKFMEMYNQHNNVLERDRVAEAIRVIKDQHFQAGQGNPFAGAINALKQAFETLDKGGNIDPIKLQNALEQAGCYVNLEGSIIMFHLNGEFKGEEFNERSKNSLTDMHLDLLKAQNPQNALSRYQRILEKYYTDQFCINFMRKLNAFVNLQAQLDNATDGKAINSAAEAIKKAIPNGAKEQECNKQVECKRIAKIACLEIKDATTESLEATQGRAEKLYKDNQELNKSSSIINDMIVDQFAPKYLTEAKDINDLGARLAFINEQYKTTTEDGKKINLRARMRAHIFDKYILNWFTGKRVPYNGICNVDCLLLLGNIYSFSENEHMKQIIKKPQTLYSKDPTLNIIVVYLKKICNEKDLNCLPELQLQLKKSDKELTPDLLKQIYKECFKKKLSEIQKQLKNAENTAYQTLEAAEQRLREASGFATPDIPDISDLGLLFAEQPVFNLDDFTKKYQDYVVAVDAYRRAANPAIRQGIVCNIDLDELEEQCRNVQRLYIKTLENKIKTLKEKDKNVDTSEYTKALTDRYQNLYELANRDLLRAPFVFNDNDGDEQIRNQLENLEIFYTARNDAAEQYRSQLNEDKDGNEDDLLALARDDEWAKKYYTDTFITILEKLKKPQLADNQTLFELTTERLESELMNPTYPAAAAASAVTDENKDKDNALHLESLTQKYSAYKKAFEGYKAKLKKDTANSAKLIAELDAKNVELTRKCTDSAKRYGGTLEDKSH